MKAIAVTIGLLIAMPTVSQAQQKAILLFGGDGHKDFLGCLSCSEYDKDSVWNEFSKHGWGNDFGTWNDFGKFASEFSKYSACNDLATDPPVIVDRSGAYYGRLSISDSRSDSVCASDSTERICVALKVMCADN